MTKKFQIGNITVSGTWALITIAEILRRHKEGDLSTSDAVWEFIKKVK